MSENTGITLVVENTDGNELLRWHYPVGPETFSIIMERLQQEGHVSSGQKFSVSVVGGETFLEVRTADEFERCISTTQGSPVRVVLRHWGAEERVAEWTALLTKWYESGICTKTDEVVQLARCGVPHRLRKEVYCHLGGVHYAKQKHGSLYRSLCQQAEEKVSPGVLMDIEKDLRRTFATHRAFRHDAAATEAMRRVLVAYSLHQPQVGYCQGMSFVVALLLLVLRQHPTDAEEQHDIAWGDKEDQAAEEELKGLQRSLTVIAELAESRNAALVAHLEQLGVPLSCLVVRWLPCLFAGAMASETVLRIWDMIMAEGTISVYRAAIAAVEIKADELLEAADLTDVTNVMQSPSGLEDGTCLVHQMHSSWPWLASWMYPPDISSADTNRLWTEIRAREETEIASEDLEMSFLQTWELSTSVYPDFGEGHIQLTTEGSWCLPTVVEEA